MKDVHKKHQPRFSITQLENGWYFDSGDITGGGECWNGPYPRRIDAQEAARSLRDNGSQNFTSEQICTGRRA